MPTMYEIYRAHAREYDRLVDAEDHEGNLAATLHRIVDWRGRRVVEAGTGTGRVTALYAPLAAEIHCFDRENHMLEAARRRLARHGDKVSFGIADNRELPALPRKAEIFVEGWSWGHAVVDGPGTVEEVLARLVASAGRCVRPGGSAVLIETLGTHVTYPAAPDDRLAVMYEVLEGVYGLTRETVRTDYRFATPVVAAEVMGFFFGPEMGRRIRAEGLTTVPEWTGVWHGRLDRAVTGVQTPGTEVP